MRRATLTPEERRERQREYKRRYLATHPEQREKASVRSRDYLRRVAQDPEALARLREQQRRVAKQRYWRDPEAANAKGRQWYQDHKPQHREWVRAWNKAHPELVREIARRASRKRSLERFLTGQGSLSLRMLMILINDVPEPAKRETLLWFIEDLKRRRKEAQVDRSRAYGRSYYAANQEHEQSYHRDYMRMYRRRRKEQGRPLR